MPRNYDEWRTHIPDPPTEEEFDEAFQNLLEQTSVDEFISIPGVEALILKVWEDKIVGHAMDMKNAKREAEESRSVDSAET